MTYMLHAACCSLAAEMVGAGAPLIRLAALLTCMGGSWAATSFKTSGAMQAALGVGYGWAVPFHTLAQCSSTATCCKWRATIGIQPVMHAGFTCVAAGHVAVASYNVTSDYRSASKLCVGTRDRHPVHGKWAATASFECPAKTLSAHSYPSPPSTQPHAYPHLPHNLARGNGSMVQFWVIACSCHTSMLCK